MITQQLLDYIRQNLVAGTARTDIEKALLVAGWVAQDVNDGFAMIDHPERMAPPSPVVPTSIPQVIKPVSTDDNAAETARIRQELELEAKRQKWRSVTTDTPVVGGIIGWLVAKKIVEEESQANIALLGVAIIAGVLAIGIYMWWNSSTNRPALTPNQIEAQQRPAVSTPINQGVSP